MNNASSVWIFIYITSQAQAQAKAQLLNNLSSNI